MSNTSVTHNFKRKSFMTIGRQPHISRVALEDCVITDVDDDDDSGVNACIAAVLRRRQLARTAAIRRQRSGPRGPKRKPFSHFSWVDHLHRLSDRDFKLRYRIDREGFNILHSMLQRKLETKNKVKVNFQFRMLSRLLFTSYDVVGKKQPTSRSCRL